MDAALQYSTYMFMIVTERFCHDSWAELQRDEALMESISDRDKRWSVTDGPTCTVERENFIHQSKYTVPVS